MNIEPDLDAAKSGLLNWTKTNWKWLAACAFCFLLGISL